MTEFIHEKTLTDLGLDYNKLNVSMKGRINNFKRLKSQLNSKKPYSKDEERKLKLISAAIADDLITIYEENKPEPTEVITKKRIFTAEEKQNMVAQYRRKKDKGND